MKLARREFLALAAAAAAGCATKTPQVPPPGVAGGTVDAGPVTDYAKDGVYSKFRDRGFFVIRRGATLMAMSSVCPHRACKVSPQPDCGFLCHCHASKFTADGALVHGPATIGLPHLATCQRQDQHLIVNLDKIA